MEKYDVIIIGAGIGGLTAGNILAKNGMKVLILEKNHVPGGAVTTFYRNGYPIDISHAICGLNENCFLKNIFSYLNIFNKIDPIKLDVFFISLDNNFKQVFCYTDINKFRNELHQNFPQEKNINCIVDKIQTIWNKEISNSLYNPSLVDLLYYPFKYPHLIKYRNSTYDQFLNTFTKNESLKNILSISWPYLGLNKNKVSALYMISMLSAYLNN